MYACMRVCMYICMYVHICRRQPVLEICEIFVLTIALPCFSKALGVLVCAYGNWLYQPLAAAVSPVPSACTVGRKVKVTLVQALRLCTCRTAHRGSRGIALPFHHHGTRRVWGVSVKPRPFFTPGKDPVPIVQEAGWAPGPVWTGAENFAATGIRSPGRAAGSQLLCRLSL